MTESLLVGSTGLVGRNILQTLLNHPAVSSVHAFSRRDLSVQNSKLKPIIESDSSKWTSSFPVVPESSPSIFFSSLGTTRGRAGGFDKQRAIDHDLNIAMAREAQAKGIKNYVLISSGGANSSSMFGYMKMKGQTEEAVIDLGFENCVIVRPGVIVGQRDESRPAEFVLRKLAGLAGSASNGLKDSWAQDAEVIARAAVSGGLKSSEGKSDGKIVNCAGGSGETKVWYLEQKDIVRLGRTEWKE